MKTQNIKLITVVILCLSVRLGVNAQTTSQKIGANPTVKAPSAVLELESTNKGILAPRIALVSTTVATPVTAPANALTVFNTATTGDVTPGYYYWKEDTITPANSKWVRLIDALPPITAWFLNGNTATTANNFLGTTDDMPLNFKIDNTVAGKISKNATSYGYKSNTGTGIQNTAIGQQAMELNTTGERNTAVGALSLNANTGGQSNTAFGNETLLLNTTGNINTAVGNYALRVNTTGFGNTAIGANTLGINTGDNNTALGEAALNDNRTGTQNTGVGKRALEKNKTGDNNTAVGSFAGVTEENLSNTTAIGYLAKVSASNSMALGGQGIYGVNVGVNTATPTNKLHVVGNGALDPVRFEGLQASADATDKIVVADANGVLKTVLASTSAHDLRMVGLGNHITQDAGVGGNGTSAGTGAANIGIGPGTLASNTTGGNNVAIGQSALAVNTTGIENVALGAGTLASKTTGNYNTALGASSLVSTTTGEENTSVGRSAMYANTTGSLNTSVGMYSLLDMTTGASNVALGYYAGKTLTGGNNNIFIGYDTKPNVSTTGSNQLNIGNWIYGNGGLIGIGTSAINPSARLDVANGNLRVRDINTVTGLATDNIVIADNTGVLKTIAPGTLLAASQKTSSVVAGTNTTVAANTPAGSNNTAYTVNVPTANGIIPGVVKQASANPTVNVAADGTLSVNTTNIVSAIGKNFTSPDLTITNGDGATLTAVSAVIAPGAVTPAKIANSPLPNQVLVSNNSKAPTWINQADFPFKNIYNTDGQLTDNRTVDMNTKTFSFKTSDNTQTRIVHSGGGNVLTNAAESARSQISLISGTNELRLLQNNNAEAQIVTVGQALTVGSYSGTLKPLALQTNGTDRIRLDPTGKVGIGITPATILTEAADINGTLRVRDLPTNGAVNAIYNGEDTKATTFNATKTVVVNSQGVMGTVPGLLTAEPWRVTGSSNAATSNTENIYQTGNVSIGANAGGTAILSVFNKSASTNTADLDIRSDRTAGDATPGSLSFYSNLAAGAFTNLSSVGDKGLIFSTDGNGTVNTTNGFVIAPHISSPANYGLKLTEQGKVGINAATPLETADINGTLRIRDLPTDGTASAIYNGAEKKATAFNATKTVVVDANGVMGTVPGLPTPASLGKALTGALDAVTATNPTPAATPSIEVLGGGATAVLAATSLRVPENGIKQNHIAPGAVTTGKMANSPLANQVLVSDGSNLPTWINQSALTQNNIYTTNGTLATDATNTRLVDMNNKILNFTTTGTNLRETRIDRSQTPANTLYHTAATGTSQILMQSGTNANLATLNMMQGDDGYAQVFSSGAGSSGLIVGTGTSSAKPLLLQTKGSDRMSIDATGKIVMNALDAGVTGPVLNVNGTIETANSTFPDYVFEDYFNGFSELKSDYSFKSLKEVEAFINKNKHLPGVTSIKGLRKNEKGDYVFNISELSIQMLEKVEELYLHTIEQQKLIDQQQAEIKALKEDAEATKARLEKLEKMMLENQKKDNSKSGN